MNNNMYIDVDININNNINNNKMVNDNFFFLI